MHSDKKPLINAETYQLMYEDSINNPDDFWAKQA